MASVAALPNLVLYIGIVGADPQSPIILQTSPIGETTPTHTQHSLVVMGGSQYVIIMSFDPSIHQMTRTFPGDLVEVTIRLDGNAVLHHLIPVAYIIDHQGRLYFSAFTGTTACFPFCSKLRH
jgi:hypothetical protein